MNELPNTMHECLIPWTLNGKCQRSLCCSGDRMEELIRGILFSRGLIGHPLAPLSISAEDGILNVEVPGTLPEEPVNPELPAPVESDYCPSMGTVDAIRPLLRAESGNFGTHTAILIGKSGAVIREDIGRHNAIEKAIAGAAMAGFDPGRCVLGTTGRVSLEILCKAAHAGIPVIFTNKYPSDLVIEKAEALRVMICFRRAEEPVWIGYDRRGGTRGLPASHSDPGEE